MHYEILVDHGETANKCTIVPLAYRSDFRIRRFARGEPIKPLSCDVLLHPEGVPIDQFSAPTAGVQGLAAIDCIWKRLDPIIHWLEKPLPTLVSIPTGFVTAYPRVSKYGRDPDGGLATIEALFIGAAFLGHWDHSLLAEYFFADQFLDLNAKRFCQLGLTPPGRDKGSVFKPRHPRSAWQRRIARGRAGDDLLARVGLKTEP